MKEFWTVNFFIILEVFFIERYYTNTVESPNNESFGIANFLEVFFIERFKCIEEYANGTLEKFHYERFFTIGGVHYRRFHCINRSK